MTATGPKPPTTLEALGIGPEDGLQLALTSCRKEIKGQVGCKYFTVSPGIDCEVSRDRSGFKERRPATRLEQRIFNPGGTKNADIRFCRFLMFEDDGEGGPADKKHQWETVGLMRPPFQIWTGGKSVHHYCLLLEPCTPDMYRKRLIRLSRRDAKRRWGRH